MPENIAATASYFPTLGLRPSEMRALEELPESTKDRLEPVVLLAPWATSLELANSLKRIEKAYGKRLYYLDTDLRYQSASDRQAIADFNTMKNEGGAYNAYFEFVAQSDYAVPTLQLREATEANILEQINSANEIGRGFLIRVSRSSFSSEQLPLILTALETGLANFRIAIDCEWLSDIQSGEVWASGILSQLNNASNKVPVIISATSFPKSFSDIEGIETTEIGSRKIFSNLRGRFGNSLDLLYGDWGTTRPREYTGGQTPPPRIDYPTDENWIFFRDPEKWNYRQAALALVNSSHWNSSVNVWGKLMIEKTAAGDVSGITNPTGNVAARINIHLHLQSWFGDASGVADTDDPWSDDL